MTKLTKLNDLLNGAHAVLDAVRGHKDVTSSVPAQAAINKIFAELDKLEKFAAARPMQKVIVMPTDDKNSFALEAMAHAMGLKITEAEVVAEEEPEVISTPVGTPTAPAPVAEPEPEVFQNNTGFVPKAELPKPTDAELIAKHIEEKGVTRIETGAQTISKATGKPKRKYVKSGKFTAEELAKRKPRRSLRMS